ncbi:toll/interleukin-1 receptor domain-containing protein [Pontibacter sp. 172403-2]|uniref:toll/interleukin-1 receptor domain-containing protein n=1 Tax=Pontibacter rufus TaxID=2791028 RepID=UPI0018AF9D23|nr:toll/interleukin-1 receptor domain-containing protein [Pontibacter sp. 172403-2]MBF9254230.1 toll/interleukin-1 receptor domain-containing protein [Pontibacter sp. 172403-2]
MSPDYIASNYCYEKEFQRAIQLQEERKLIIVPIILEPCDWLNTPFKDFKAIPTDGKPISTWANVNTAFLNVTENLRKLIVSAGQTEVSVAVSSNSGFKSGRNYRVKKDFDTIEKLEFKEKSFKELTDLLKRYMEEINVLENIKTRIYKDAPSEFECMIVNRNKIGSECLLKVSFDSSSSTNSGYAFNRNDLKYELHKDGRNNEKGFILKLDEYHLFWEDSNSLFYPRDSQELSIQEMADLIWEEWLESVDISL